MGKLHRGHRRDGSLPTNERGIPTPRALRVRATPTAHAQNCPVVIKSAAFHCPTALPLLVEEKQVLVSSTHPLNPAELLSAADMAGLVKAKKYDWKDSNLALFGSDTERNVRFVV